MVVVESPSTTRSASVGRLAHESGSARRPRKSPNVEADDTARVHRVAVLCSGGRHGRRPDRFQEEHRRVTGVKTHFTDVCRPREAIAFLRRVIQLRAEAAVHEARLDLFIVEPARVGGLSKNTAEAYGLLLTAQSVCGPLSEEQPSSRASRSMRM